MDKQRFFIWFFSSSHTCDMWIRSKAKIILKNSYKGTSTLLNSLRVNENKLEKFLDDDLLRDAIVNEFELPQATEFRGR